jgi:hypothetical protein
MITIGTTVKSIDTIADEFLEYYKYPPLWWFKSANESEG